MSISDSQAMRIGASTVTTLQNEYVARFGAKWTIGLDELKNSIQLSNPNGLIDIGRAVIDSGLGMRRIQESMERVPYKVGMKIPSVYQINQGIVEELSSFDFSLLGDTAIEIGRDAVKASNAAIESGSKIVGGVVDSAESLSGNLKYLVPAIVALAVGIFVYVNSKKV